MNPYPLPVSSSSKSSSELNSERGDSRTMKRCCAVVRAASNAVSSILRIPAPLTPSLESAGARGVEPNYSTQSYFQERGGSKVSLMERELIQRDRLALEPALSLVPLARLPPKGC